VTKGGGGGGRRKKYRMEVGHKDEEGESREGRTSRLMSEGTKSPTVAMRTI